ncbi:MAG: D-glycero-beta-D-manno-heptose 1-phosphate adenylyltransferase [Scytonema sp. RU_4_4]|nr:D-glycero-beta-D-manno-heptose 1-phosphate adenylyltransferase [Scytonema sp. RU_4_4]NJR76604.1 D-glycero-beta-D-manno-heptose 1-phosphate adenylyltransferase [Scytonema sp. CRU_2_7]
MLDCYLQGENFDNIESPVPIVTVNNCKQILGGAADIACSLKSLGSQVIFLSVIGKDSEGHSLRQTLEESGITTSYLLTHATRETLTRQTVTVESQLFIRIDSGSTDVIDSCTEQTLINQIKDSFAECHAVIVCDYGYGIVTQKVRQTLAQLQQNFPHIFIVEKQTRELTKVMTPPSSSSPLPTFDKHICDLDQLLALVTSHHIAGRKIVFTNGCFDILHAGHVSYLQRAKALGDILIIGVNSDNSVRRLKGPTRPINPLEDRIQVLAALGCVDYLIPFEEDSPSHLIRKLRPNIYVKGGDYTKDTLPETPVVEEYGGVIEFLPFLENRSTTKTIERISQGKNQ